VNRDHSLLVFTVSTTPRMRRAAESIRTPATGEGHGSVARCDAVISLNRLDFMVGIDKGLTPSPTIRTTPGAVTILPNTAGVRRRIVPANSASFDDLDTVGHRRRSPYEQEHLVSPLAEVLGAECSRPLRPECEPLTHQCIVATRWYQCHVPRT